jgi:hypothetical protein
MCTLKYSFTNASSFLYKRLSALGLIIAKAINIWDWLNFGLITAKAKYMG